MLANIATPSDAVSIITAVITSGSGFAFAAWLSHHLLTKTVPEMTTSYTSSLERLANQFTATSKEQTDQFTKSSEKQMAEFGRIVEDERKYREQEMRLHQAWLREEVACKYQIDLRGTNYGNPNRD